MTNVTNELIFETLKRLQSDVAEHRTETRVEIADVKTSLGKQIAILADGLISLRRDVQELTNSVQVLVISTAGHGERLADVEHRLDSIDQKLGPHLSTPTR